MCRFVMYLGEPIALENLLTKPVNSLVKQSFDAELRDTVNGDGFGVAWYVPGLEDAPAVYKAATPAWHDRNLRDLSRVTRSDCVLAHVRAATPGIPAHELNCHPFVVDRLAFMHNGHVGGFASIRRDLLALLSDTTFNAIEGTTDSEHLFALFLDCWHRLVSGGATPIDALTGALEETITTVIRLQHAKGNTTGAWLNIAVSDGRRAVASHYAHPAPRTAPTLYWHEGRRYVCEGGVVAMVDPDVRSDTVIVASEPLSADPGWEPVPQNSMIAVDDPRRISIRPIGANGAGAPQVRT